MFRSISKAERRHSWKAQHGILRPDQQTYHHLAEKSLVLFHQSSFSVLFQARQGLRKATAMQFLHVGCHTSHPTNSINALKEQSRG